MSKIKAYTVDYMDGDVSLSDNFYSDEFIKSSEFIIFDNVFKKEEERSLNIRMYYPIDKIRKIHSMDCTFK